MNAVILSSVLSAGNHASIRRHPSPVLAERRAPSARHLPADDCPRRSSRRAARHEQCQRDLSRDKLRRRWRDLGVVAKHRRRFPIRCVSSDGPSHRCQPDVRTDRMAKHRARELEIPTGMGTARSFS